MSRSLERNCKIVFRAYLGQELIIDLRQTKTNRSAAHSSTQCWASECPDFKNYKWRLNPVWHRMIYSCIRMATTGVKGLIYVASSLHAENKRCSSVIVSWFSGCGCVAMVTQGPLRRLTLRDDLYVGGYVNYSAPGLLQLSRRKHQSKGIVGCIRSLRINDKVYDMSRGAFVGDALYLANIGKFTGQHDGESFRNVSLQTWTNQTLLQSSQVSNIAFNRFRTVLHGLWLKLLNFLTSHLTSYRLLFLFVFLATCATLSWPHVKLSYRIVS